MRVGRGPNLTGQQMEKAVGMVQAGSGMQVSWRTGGVLVMKGACQVISKVWVGEKQLEGRTGRGLVMKGAGWVSSMVLVWEKQLDGRTGGVLVMKGADRVSSEVKIEGSSSMG